MLIMSREATGCMREETGVCPSVADADPGCRLDWQTIWYIL